MVSWEKMRGFWIYSTFQVSKDTGENVKTYLNKYVTNNTGYSFTITQLYNELFYACITISQCSDIKRKLERKFKLKLEDVPTQELFPGAAKRIKMFKNAHEFRRFRENDLPNLNRPIIRRKHGEASEHFINVKSAFNTEDQKSFIAFDLEVYEHDHSQVLEIGYVIVRFSPTRPPTDGDLPEAEVTSRKHLIIEENLHYKNKDNVPDNRDGFRFGVSETLSLEDAVERLVFACNLLYMLQTTRIMLIYCCEVVRLGIYAHLPTKCFIRTLPSFLYQLGERTAHRIIFLVTIFKAILNSVFFSEC